MYTVGTTLKEKREAMGLSINDVVKATKIDKLYVDAIENSDFSFFENQDFYHQVFVGSYAEFLGLSKNDVLRQLQDDMVKGKEELKEIKAQRAADAPLQMDTDRVKKYLSEYDLKADKPAVQPQSEPVQVAQQPTQPIVEPQAAFQQKVPEQVMPVQSETISNYEETNDEINQLIQDINQSSNANVDEYFDDSTSSFIQESIPETPVVASGEQPVMPPESDELLNSSIFDEIEKISNQVETNKELEDSLPEITEAAPAKDFNFNKPLESTAVIDLTSGIEIETVSNNQAPVFTPSEMVDEQLKDEESTLEQENDAILNDMVSVPVQADALAETNAPVDMSTPPEMATQAVVEPPVPSLDEILNKDEKDEAPVNPFLQEVSTEKVVVDSKSEFNFQEPVAEASVLEELEKTIHDSKVLSNDPDKTAMDLKIAKALGDNKVEMDTETTKRVKRDKIIDIILIILILALVAYFGFMVYTHVIKGN